MSTQFLSPEKIKDTKPPVIGLKGRRIGLRIFATVIMIVYSVVTLFPFYALFIRSFVPTKESSELHLWLPEVQEVSVNQEIGNLAVFYNLDMKAFKIAMGIPETAYIPSRDKLVDVAEKYNLNIADIQQYFEGFYLYNGWNTLFRTSMNSQTFWRALTRTFIVTFFSLLLSIILSIMTGYGLAGLKRKDQMTVYNIYLLQMVIPIMLIILPQYQLFQWIYNLFPQYNVQGSAFRYSAQLIALILINIKGTALSTMIFTSAISGIPKDLEDSAMIDGASRIQYLRQILFPLLKVPIVSLVVIQLPAFYNQFLEPYVYLDPPNSTLLPFIQSAVGQFSTNFQVIYAGVFASVVPLVILYLVFRSYFVEGVMAGAIKG
ncbi:MAG: carbohydrate ABC transporter permease [bacterium]|jgi:raffinose/stachyose/melibiose transport system permease protein